MHLRFVSIDGYSGFQLLEPVTLVGRDRACDASLGSSRVSRRHCCVASVGGEISVRDLGSTNGTWINGQRVQSGFLRPGDVLGIAHLRFLLTVMNRADFPAPGAIPSPDAAAGDHSA